MLKMAATRMNNLNHKIFVLHKRGPSSSQEHSVKMPLIKPMKIIAKLITLTQTALRPNHLPAPQVEKLNMIQTNQTATHSTADQNMIT